MKNKIIFYSLIFMLFVSPHVLADEVKEASIQKVGLSFEQAYELMLVNNNALKAATKEIKQRDYERKSAIGQYFPKVAINSTYAHLSENIATQTPVPGMGSLVTPIQGENLWFVGGGAVWNIFTGGKIIANHKASIEKLNMTSEKYRQVKNDLTVELVKRYYGLRFARDVIDVRTQYLANVKKHYEDAILLEKEGVIPKSERLHAEVAYTQAERELDSAIRDANVVEDSLKTLIKDKNANLKGVTVEPNSYLFLYNAKFLTSDEYRELAIKNNPLLKQANSKTKLANIKYKAEIANYYPNVSLFAYDIAGQSQLSYLTPRWAVGGSVNFLLFDGLSRYNNVRAAQIGKEVASYEQEDANFNIECLVNKQYQELMKYKEEFESTNKSLESAKEAVRTTSLGFQEGFRTSLEVTDADLALLGVRLGRLKALYNYDTTLCDLLRTTGDTYTIFDYMKNSTKEKL